MSKTRSKCSFVAGVLTVAVARFAEAVPVTLNIRNEQFEFIPARVHIVDAYNTSFPGMPDSLLLAHYGGVYNRGFYYSDGHDSLDLPLGLTTITVGRGFEYRPVTVQRNVFPGASIHITLERAYDLRAEGWSSGDDHVHAKHPPADYLISPEEMLRIAQAEDLQMTWCLDNSYQFTGGAHAVSTPQNSIYFTTEFRNQAYGHVEVLGLTQAIPTGCCLPPTAAYPMLSDFNDIWVPQYGQALVLAHPCTPADYFFDGGWPGWGLGREFPLLALNNRIDAYDIVSFNNEGHIALPQWYDALDCGSRIPAGAGSDAAADRYYNQFPGGYRVYVYEGPGTHTPARYVEALKSGRTFVTNYPLLPEFTVNDALPGTTLLLPGGQSDLTVKFRVESVLPVAVASIVRDGEIVEAFPLTQLPTGTSQACSTVVPVTESGWIAIRVDGVTTTPHAAQPALFAHTSPVYYRVFGDTTKNTPAAGRMADRCDSLELFVEARGGWASPDHRAHVLTKIHSGRSQYNAFFRVPPDSFALLSPYHGDTVEVGAPLVVSWEAASDSEPGDRVEYLVSFSPDSLFLFAGAPIPTRETSLDVTASIAPKTSWWWRVVARDRNGNARPSTPSQARFHYFLIATDVDQPNAPVDPGDPGHLRLIASPNPCSGPLVVRLSRPLRDDGEIAVYSVDGRLITHSSLAAPRRGWTTVTRSLLRWDGRGDSGEPLPGGAYWLRAREEERHVAATRVILVR